MQHTKRVEVSHRVGKRLLDLIERQGSQITLGRVDPTIGTRGFARVDDNVGRQLLKIDSLDENIEIYFETPGVIFVIEVKARARCLWFLRPDLRGTYDILAVGVG